ncbi:MAG: ATP-binding protein, partial [Acidimicrobiales bacterium]
MRIAAGNHTIGGRLRRAFGLLVAITLVSGAVGVGSLVVVVRTQNNVVQHYEPLRQSNTRILADMTYAETSIRDYLLTGKRSFLQPYVAGLAAFSRESGSVAGLAGGDPTVLSLFNRSRAAAEAWLHGFAAPIAAGPGGPTDSSAARNAHGNSLFDTFLLANQAVAHAIDRKSAQAIRQGALTWDVALGGLIVVALLAVASGIVVAARVDRAISRPLDDVGHTMHELVGGNTSARAPNARIVEIQGLASSLNQLADETERHRAESDDRTRMRQLAAEVSRHVLGELDDRAVLDQAAISIGTALDADRVLIRSTDGGGQPVVLVAQWAAEGTDPLVPAPRLATSVNEAADFWSDAAGTLVIEDCATVPFAEPGIRSDWESGGVGSLIRQMLRTGDELIGTVLVTDRTGRRWSEGEVELVRVVAGDLGRALDHARMYRDQQDLVAQLRELDNAKSTFLATVSHELRTPLTSIAGYMELIQDGDAGPTTPAQDRMFEVIARNTTRLRTLIDDLLALSRIESGALGSTREQVVLGDLVRSVQAVLAPVAEQGDVSLRGVPEEPAGWVWGDAIQLERALLNLVSNAVKFTPAGGEVTIRSCLDGPDALLVVTDTGIGIPADEQKAVFGQFHRASNAIAGVVPGTGLGLAISRAIVEQHGGTLTLTSVVDVGT